MEEKFDFYHHSAIGSDEVGTGDVFGSIVVCSTHVDNKNILFLKDINVRDSKKITDKKIMEMAPKIISKITYSLVSVDPYKYNGLTKRGFNLNKIKALLHNDMILKTLNKIKKNVLVILDKFTSERSYFKYLKDEKNVYKKIIFCNKAEQAHISVAAASIIARYAFLKNIARLSKQVGIQLKLGASKKVDEQVKIIHERYGMDGLKKIAKCNFRNIKKQLFKDYKI